MAHPENQIQANIESDLEPIPSYVIQDAALIINDKTSTMREKMLARSIMEIADTFNKMVVAFETGNAIITMRQKK